MRVIDMSERKRLMRDVWIVWRVQIPLPLLCKEYRERYDASLKDELAVATTSDGDDRGGNGENVFTCALMCIPKASVLGFLYYMCLSGVQMDIRGSGSASRVFIAKDRYTEKKETETETETEKADAGMRWIRAWIVAALTIFGPLLTSMIGRLFNEVFGRQFSAAMEEGGGGGIARFLKRNKKYFTLTPLKGNECVVRLAAHTAIPTSMTPPASSVYAHRLGKSSSAPLAKAGESILILGDGDVSFGRLVSSRATDAAKLVVTTLDSRVEAMHKYGSEVASNIDAITAHGGEFRDCVDATTLSETTFDGTQFDAVIFMFPHVGEVHDLWSSIDMNRKMLRDFLLRVPPLLRDTGELLITLVSRFPYSAWQIASLAPHSLRFVGSLRFDFASVPSYRHVATRIERADHDTRYELEEALTYVFQRRRKAATGTTATTSAPVAATDVKNKKRKGDASGDAEDEETEMRRKRRRKEKKKKKEGKKKDKEKGKRKSKKDEERNSEKKRDRKRRKAD